MITSNSQTAAGPKLFALIAVFSVNVVTSSCNRPSPSARAGSGEPVEVAVAFPSFRDVQRHVEVTGTLYADEQAQIAALIPGRIVAMLKDVGDRVTPGELIARIDRTDYELARQQRQASVAEALSRLGLDRMPGPEFDPMVLPAVLRAKAQEENARAKFERGKLLYESEPPLISTQDFADLQTTHEVASHNVTAEGLAGRTLLAQARSRAADLHIAEQQLKDTDIHAPERAGDEQGYAVAARITSVGEFIGAGQPVYTLVDVDPIKFRAETPERFSSDVRLGLTVRVRLDALADEQVGRITRISPQVDSRSRTFLLEAEIPNTDGRLKPGSFGIGRVETHMQTAMPFVPESAIVSFAGVIRIFTIESGKAVEHRIGTGEVIDGQVEVLGGTLAADAAVVISGANKLSNGASVRVVASTSSSGLAGEALSSAAEPSKASSRTSP